MNYNLIFTSLTLLFLMFLSIKIYLYFSSKYKSKQYKSYSVIGVEDDHKPIIVNDDYLAAQSGLTLEEYNAKISAYKNSRFKKQELEKENSKSGINKKANKIDDNLGMHF